MARCQHCKKEVNYSATACPYCTRSDPVYHGSSGDNFESIAFGFLLFAIGAIGLIFMVPIVKKEGIPAEAQCVGTGLIIMVIGGAAMIFSGIKKSFK